MVFCTAHFVQADIQRCCGENCHTRAPLSRRSVGRHTHAGAHIKHSICDANHTHSEAANDYFSMMICSVHFKSDRLTDMSLYGGHETNEDASTHNAMD